MNTTIYTAKNIFYFRGEDSVKKAITKITKLLWNVNKDSTPLTGAPGEDKSNNDYMLNIHDPKLEITFYKKEFKLYDQPSNFATFLHSMEENLTETFTEIRIKNLASSLEVSKNKRDLNEVSLRKGIPRTLVFINISTISTITETPLIIPKIKRSKKVVTVNIQPLEENPNILKRLGKLTIDLPSKELSGLTTKKVSKTASSPKEIKNPLGASKITKTIKKPSQSKKSDSPLSVEVKINYPDLSLGKTLWSSFSKIGSLGKGVNTGMSNFVEKIGETGSDKSIRNIRNLLSNIFTPLNSLISETLNLFHTIPNFVSNTLIFITFVCYCLIYAIVLTITLIITGLNLLPEIPFLSDFLQNINLYLINSPNLFNSLNLDCSIFDNISKIIKNIEADAPISEIIPEIIKQTESLIGNNLPETLKEAITNTFVSLSEAERGSSSSYQGESLRSSDVTTSLDEKITINEDKPKDEPSVFMTILYTVGYTVVGLVAFDMVSRIPSDPEFYSSLGDFASGIVSIGVLSLTSLLQMIFGTNDNNNNSSGSNSNKSESFSDKWRSDRGNTLDIEYKKDGEQSRLLRFKEGIASALRGDEIREDKLNKNGKICIEYRTEPEPLKFLQITENIKSALRGDEVNTTNKKVKFALNDNKADDILGLSSYLPSFPINGSSSSSPSRNAPLWGANSNNNNNNLFDDVTNTATNLYNGVSNTSRNIVNGVTSTGENIINAAQDTGKNVINVAQDTGKNVINGVSNTTKNISNGISDTFTPSHKQPQEHTLFSGFMSSEKTPFISNDSVKEAVKTHISPWGAEYKDPQRLELRDRIKEDNSTSILSSAKKLLYRRGDETFTHDPNTGPLRTNITDSMIPIVDFNKSDGTMERYSNLPILSLNDEPMQLGSHLDPIYETIVLSDNSQNNRDSQAGDIFIYNNIITPPYFQEPSFRGEEGVVTAKVPLDRSIINQTDFMDGLTPKESMDIIHSYGEQVMDLNDAIQMKEDLLVFQEKELQSHQQFQKSQEVTIYGQNEVISEQTREIDSQQDVLNVQRQAIDKQGLALQRARSALKTLTNSINFTNENSLLTRKDVDQMINGISSEVEHQEHIPDRFQALRDNAVRHNYGDHNNNYTKDLAQDLMTEYNNNNADRMLTEDKIPLLKSNLTPINELKVVDNFMSNPPLRSSSLEADYVMAQQENDKNISQTLTRSQTLREESSSKIPLPITRSFSLREITPNDSISSVNEIIEPPTRSTSLRVDKTVEVYHGVTRSNTLPTIQEEFWDRQPENGLIKGKIKWKYGL